jgi:hypothetical protein
MPGNLNERVPREHARIPNVRNWAVRDYGNRAGIWRIMEVLTRYGIRASAALNGEVCDHHPEIIEEAGRLGWELIGHNQTNALRLTEMDETQECDAVRGTIDRIEAAFGRPVGWLGAGLAETWNTLDYLAEAGIRYVCDWVNDDQPYFFEIGNPPLVSRPYSAQTNDVPAYFEMKASVPEFEAMLRRQLDTLYRRGRNCPPCDGDRGSPVRDRPSRTGSVRSTRHSNTSARMRACGAPPAGRSCSTFWRNNRKAAGEFCSYGRGQPAAAHPAASMPGLPRSRILGVRSRHSPEIGQDWHFLQVLGAEARPVDARWCGARALDADRAGWRRDHAERLIGGVAGHGVDDLQIVHGRGDGHGRVTELAQDGEFQVAVAFALATATPIARDRDRAADNGIEPRHVREGHLFRPAVAARQAGRLLHPVGRDTVWIKLLEAAAQSGRRHENGDAAAQRLGSQRALR